jgi:hypothetical protein
LQREICGGLKDPGTRHGIMSMRRGGIVQIIQTTEMKCIKEERKKKRKKKWVKSGGRKLHIHHSRDSL